jgi:hypothetical protein
VAGAHGHLGEADPLRIQPSLRNVLVCGLQTSLKNVGVDYDQVIRDSTK